MSNTDFPALAISSADRIIDSVCQKSHVTAEGKKWLKLAINPFPDETTECGGYPDMISSKSNVVPFKLTTTITGAAFPTPWDCLVAFNGSLESDKVRLTTRTSNRFSGAGQSTVDHDIGGIQVRSALTGTPLDLTTVTGNLFAGTPTDRPWRLISAGLEVHNETEPLNRSGKVVCFRQPTVPGDKFTAGIVDSAGTTVSPVTAISRTPLPESLSNAQNIPDSTNWSAEDGGYIVFAMDGPTNPVIGNPEYGSIFPAPWIVDEAHANNFFPAISGASPNQLITGFGNSTVPYNNCGLYFADLSPQTKLDIVWHLVIEEFPPTSDRTLSALATPSASFDPEALALYAKALRQLPVAVPVSENGLGSFFLEAARSIAQWAAPKLLKGLDGGEEKKEDHELAKIKAELEVLRELQIQQRSAGRPVQPRSVQASPQGNVKIIPVGKPKVQNNEKPLEPRTRISSESSGPAPRAKLATPTQTRGPLKNAKASNAKASTKK